MRGIGLRGGIATALSVGLLGIGACGGGGGSDAPKVGDCIDADHQVVDCGSSDAAMTLTSDQNAPDAMACIAISDPPEVDVTIGDEEFCAQPK